MTRSTHDHAIVTTLFAGDIALLWLGRPRVAALAAHVTHPYRWVASVGSDNAAATLARTGLWLCAVWVALAVLSVAASRLPGAAGRLASALARRTVPAMIRRSIAGAVGASIFLAPLAAGAASAPRAPIASVTSISAPVPTRTAESQATSGPGGVCDPGASTLAGSWAWPTNPRGASASAGSQHPDGDRVPAQVPWPHDSPRRPASGDIVVRPGDSLWAIAAHRLAPGADSGQIAAATEQWYEDNRSIVGPDPGLIQPGQHLHEPTEKGHRS